MVCSSRVVRGICADLARTAAVGMFTVLVSKYVVLVDPDTVSSVVGDDRLKVWRSEGVKDER